MWGVTVGVPVTVGFGDAVGVGVAGVPLGVGVAPQVSGSLSTVAAVAENLEKSIATSERMTVLPAQTGRMSLVSKLNGSPVSAWPLPFVSSKKPTFPLLKSSATSNAKSNWQVSASTGAQMTGLVPPFVAQTIKRAPAQDDCACAVEENARRATATNPLGRSIDAVAEFTDVTLPVNVVP